MLLLLLLVAVVVGCYVSGTSVELGVLTHIVGGEEVSIDKIPYQLALEKEEEFCCGASIISEYWALSAAHCVKKWSPKLFRLRSRSSLREEGGQLHQVVEIISHPSYETNPNIGDDITVLRVNTPFNKKDIISLAKVRPVAGTNTSVSGWGSTAESSVQRGKHLRLVFVPIVDQEKCVVLNFNSTITDRMICAGFPEGGKDACQGDSGGPLAVGNTQVGIVSKGLGCARKSPGVYVDVAALRSWIVEKIGQDMD